LLSEGVTNPVLVYMDKLSSAPSVDNTTTSYIGRMNFTGNLLAGHAWFELTNLITSDTNQYAAVIRVDGSSFFTYYPINLTVVGKHV
jgi:uncharacterized protein with von Willebrand factor type A (vWA) domain